MPKFCVRVVETGIVHLEVEAASADAAYTLVDEMLDYLEGYNLTFPDFLIIPLGCAPTPKGVDLSG